MHRPNPNPNPNTNPNPNPSPNPNPNQVYTGSAPEPAPLGLLAYNNFGVADSVRLASSVVQTLQGGGRAAQTASAIADAFAFAQQLGGASGINLEFSPSPSELQARVHAVHHAVHHAVQSTVHSALHSALQPTVHPTVHLTVQPTVQPTVDRMRQLQSAHGAPLCSRRGW